MRNKIYLISLFTAFLFGSCVKNLDINPEQNIDASVALENADDIRSALIGTYAILHGGALYGTNLNLVPELMGSEDYCQWRGTFQSFRQIMNKGMYVDNAEASRTWIAAYRAINVSNNILANLNKVEDVDLRNEFEAEAKFLRGAMYFELIRLYAKPWDNTGTNDGAGVPLILTASNDETTASVKKGRDNINAVYTQILNDLKDAEKNLPESFDGSERFRATTYTAKAFLVRVYLQQSKFAEALALANEIIESKVFRLNPAIAATFSNKFTNETIMELYNNDQNNAGESNDGLTTFYASLSGIGRSDIRILAPFTDKYEATDERLTELTYEGVGRRSGSTQCGKWKAYGQNIPVIRLSEMYLVRAECNLRLGSEIGQSPLADVNLIRSRAKTTPLNSVVLDDILLERNLELCFEGLRIHDIKRNKLSTGMYMWNDNNLVFPIPIREIRANSLLTQNDGY